jgi:glycosyltransferase family protein
MKKGFYQTTLHKIRSKTPLVLRHKIGPVVAYILYMFDKYIVRNSKRPNVLSIPETIDTIIKENLSVIRFGDGEIFLLDGGHTAFQKNEQDLATRLEQVILAKQKGLLICIPGIWDGLEKFDTVAYWFFMHHLYRNGHTWEALISYDRVYGDTNMTRPYLAYKDKSNCDIIFKKLFSIWEGKDVVLIEGEKSRLGVGNDLFANVASLKRILCPPENAYSHYTAIKEAAFKIDKSKLILLSLGPAAKVLAYDLFMEGYRVIDVGHVDMEYEMFLRKYKKLTKVPFKYFNEINERNPEECKDETYLDQILAKIQY